MSLRVSGGRRLQSPPGSTARPTAARVRLAVMNLLAAEVPGSRWLDLCCGSGVMACEALLRGASEVVAVERDRRIAAVARSNLAAVRATVSRRAAMPARGGNDFKVISTQSLLLLFLQIPALSLLSRSHGTDTEEALLYYQRRPFLAQMTETPHPSSKQATASFHCSGFGNDSWKGASKISRLNISFAEKHCNFAFWALFETRRRGWCR